MKKMAFQECDTFLILLSQRFDSRCLLAFFLCLLLRRPRRQYLDLHGNTRLGRRFDSRRFFVCRPNDRFRILPCLILRRLRLLLHRLLELVRRPILWHRILVQEYGEHRGCISFDHTTEASARKSSQVKF